MTIIKILKNDNKILGIECSGHCGYAEKGADIVCSAISSIMGTCHLGLERIAEAEPEFLQDDNQGYLLLKIKKNLNKEHMQIAQTILQTTVLGLSELSKDYKDFIKIISFKSV